MTVIPVYFSRRPRKHRIFTHEQDRNQKFISGCFSPISSIPSFPPSIIISIIIIIIIINTPVFSLP